MADERFKSTAILFLCVLNVINNYNANGYWVKPFIGPFKDN